MDKVKKPNNFEVTFMQYSTIRCCSNQKLPNLRALTQCYKESHSPVHTYIHTYIHTHTCKERDNYRWLYPNYLISQTCLLSCLLPITAAVSSKAWTVFARSNTGIVGSNPTLCTDVFVRLFRLCVVLCVGSGLATGWSLVQGILPTVYRIKILKKRPKSNRL
jgi:hypothetical protein